MQPNAGTTQYEVNDLAKTDDIFRLKTCPACDYSLAGLPAEGVCPECGRHYDQSFIILTGRRGARFADSKGGSWWNIGWTAAWVSLVIWMLSASGRLFSYPTTMVIMSGIAAMTIIELFFLIISPRRAQWQVWISPAGIAQVLSTPAGRSLVRIQWLGGLSTLVIAMLIFLAGNIWLMAILMLPCLVFIVTLIWISRPGSGRRISSRDFVPAFWPWKNVRNVSMHQFGGRYRLSCEVKRYWGPILVSTPSPVDLLIQCTPDDAWRLKQYILDRINRAAKGNHAH